MKKNSKTKKVGCTETKNSAEKNSDKLIATIPFQLMEVRMYETYSSKRPAYKVRIWGNDTLKPIWLCGANWLRKSEIVDDMMTLAEESTIIRSGIIQLLELCKNGYDSAVANGEQEYNYYEQRCNVSYQQTFENEVYVGIDVWNTKDGLKFCVGGSNWVYRKTDNSTMLLIDDIAFDLMFEQKKEKEVA